MTCDIVFEVKVTMDSRSGHRDAVAVSHSSKQAFVDNVTASDSQAPSRSARANGEKWYCMATLLAHSHAMYLPAQRLSIDPEMRVNQQPSEHWYNE